MSEKMELAELAQKFRNNASAVLTGDQVADEILNWAADFTIVRASSPTQEPAYPSVEAMKAAVELEIHAALGRVQTVTIGQMIQKVIDAIPAPPQPGREEIARIIEARVLGGAAWEEPQASCYRAADAILALTGEPK